MSSKRVTILEGFRQRIKSLFGPEGTIKQLFRGDRRGRYFPGKVTAPGFTVVDGGQDTGELQDGSGQMVLHVQVVLDLPDNWGADKAGDDWSELVDELIRRICNWAPKGGDVVVIDPAGDSPWEAVLEDGTSQQVWIINFDVEYHVEQEEFETSTVEEE